MDLLLVRHGESEGNIAIEAAKVGDDRWMTSEYRERSAANYRLTPTGREQATRAGEWLREWTSRRGGFDRLYCSPFVRTRETAGLLGVHNAQWQLEPLLRERDFGLWEGLGKPEIEKRFPHSFAQKSRHKFLWRPECGESTPDLDMRAREVLASLAREMSGRRVLCVTHEDIIWAFKFRLEKMTLEVFLAHQEGEGKDIPNCGIVHYTRRRQDGSVSPKFARVRLVDPSSPGKPVWQPITRPRFSNDDLLDQVGEYAHLWENRPGFEF